jgi:hypothetical protein
LHRFDQQWHVVDARWDEVGYFMHAQSIAPSGMYLQIWANREFELQKHLIFVTPQDVGQNVTAAVIHRVPEPARLAFLAHVGPPLIDFRFLNALDHHVHLVRMQGIEQRLVHRGEYRRFFFNVLNLLYLSA